MILKNILSLFLLSLLLFSCNKGEKHHLFEYVESSHSQIDFINTIVENDSVNPSDCLNCFNGGGVGIGDFNLDGLPDIVFAGNQVSSKIYLNKDSLIFQDISTESGFTTSSWVTGISVVDINEDGKDDIYLNVGGTNCEDNCSNLLFINNGIGKDGIPTFTEQAEQYGLDDGKYAQQSVFFDYDLDGDLDVYIVHNKNKTNFNRNTPRPKDRWPEYLSDYLLRNDRIEGVDHPFFVNMSDQLQLQRRGFGLGVGIADFNNDQLVDIYVSNDFITDDFFYLNRAHKDSLNPFFEEVSKDYLGHITTNAMGMDIADINDDGLSDILVVDMLPKSFKRHKRVIGEMNYPGFLGVIGGGYTAQYMRNTLQLGNGSLNGKPIKSSEVGLYYDLSSTDWSWAPLMLDFDNDGDKDIYISNGYIKDVIDLDYIQYSMKNTFFKPKLNNKKKILEDLPAIKPPNIFFEQNDRANFEEVSNLWIKEEASLSNGVAYADFDLDGDLDLVVNNINQKAFLIENKTSSRLSNHFLRVQLRGNPKNNHGIGSKITVWTDSLKQFHFQSLTRGYLSSIEPIVHFGLPTDHIDSIKVVWPDGRESFRTNVLADQLIEFHQDESKQIKTVTEEPNLLFHERTDVLNFTHQQIFNNEFRRQPLLMRQYSQGGPTIAAADIDDQPGEEVFIGGDFHTPGKIWFQNELGQYYPKQVLDSVNEDSEAVFFDADNDSDLDLYVGSGGNLFEDQSSHYADRLYLNNGLGSFTIDQNLLPKRFESTGSVVPIDIDHDNDMDLFIGSRITPRNYPRIPKSAVLINDNGRFTESENSEISQIGMVTDAIWVDIDQDNWEDLIVVGEFASISIFKNHEGELKKMKTEWFDKNGNKISSEGWWNCIRAGDFDGDGDLDLIAGNRGLNSFVKPSKGYPLYLYNQDFDQNGRMDPILGQYFKDGDEMVLFPIQTRDDVEKQFPETRIKFLTYEQFAELDFVSLLEIKDLEAETLKATTFASSYIENVGDGKFRLTPLPSLCQMSSINEILIDDFNQDNILDALLVGNDFYTESNYGRLDACTGIFLKGTETGFEAIPSRESGFYVPEQSNALLKIKDRQGRSLILAGQNNEKIKVFE